MGPLFSPAKLLLPEPEWIAFASPTSDALVPFMHAICRLSEIEQLQPGWYDQKTPSIEPSAISVAQSVVVALLVAELPIPIVFPTTEGGLSLEWGLDRLRAEVVLADDSSAIEMSDWDPDTGEHTYQENVEITTQEIRDWVARLAKRQ